MQRVRIRVDQLQVGAAVPFDIYSSEGRLLLRRGHVIESEEQLDRLVHAGHYDPTVEEAFPFRNRGQTERVVHEFDRLPSQLVRNRVSIFERLTHVVHALDDLYSLGLPAEGFEGGIRAAVADVRECCALDSDAALAHIMLSGSLRYALRQTTNAAILTTILLSRDQHDPAKSASAIAAALTMNISILTLQDTLYRQQEPVTSEQREALKFHPSESVKMLRSFGVNDALWLQAVEQHHEARDGSGYPAGLKDPAICREAQVVSLADRYCVMVSQRAYRIAFSPRQAIKELHERSASSTDPALIAGLIAAVGLYPPGAYVRLANGETAIVVRRLIDPKHPVVYALHQDTTAPYESPKKRLTANNRDFEIIADVKPENVRVKIDPETLWPPSAAAEAPPAETPSV